MVRFINNSEIDQQLAIELAERECNRAWRGASPSTWLAWCCHHALRLEALTEPYQNRIAFILSEKEPKEQVYRLNNFRPVSWDSMSKLPKRVLCAARAYKFAHLLGGRYPDDGDAFQCRDAMLNLLPILANEPDGVIATLHREDVPWHTWNGRNIFPPGVRPEWMD